MTFVLVYFSGTGNTRMVTETLAHELAGLGHSVERFSVEELSRDESGLSRALATDQSILGVGFPVYKFTYPRIMDKALRLLEDDRALIARRSRARAHDQTLRRAQAGHDQTMRHAQFSRPAFVYATYCRFAASSLHHMALQLEDRGYAPVALDSFKCPSNGIASLQNPDSFDYQSVMYFEAQIQQHVSCYAHAIVAGVEGYARGALGTTDQGTVRQGTAHGGVAHRAAPLDRLKLRVVKAVEQARYPRLAIDPERCIVCGRCVDNCPERNLTIADGRVEVADETGCLHCLRCLHICPTHAVTFGELVAGPGRYTPAVRKRLYQLAACTSPDAPEPGTPQVRRRWARANVLYWLSHR